MARTASDIVRGKSKLYADYTREQLLDSLIGCEVLLFVARRDRDEALSRVEDLKEEIRYLVRG